MVIHFSVSELSLRCSFFPTPRICSYSQCLFWCDYPVSLIWNFLTKFSLLTGVHISQNLCIFELRQLPASFTFNILRFPAQMTSVTSLVVRPFGMKNLCEEWSPKAAWLWQQNAVLQLTVFFSAKNSFSRKTSLCRNTLLMFWIATNHSISTYFCLTLHSAGMACLVLCPHLIEIKLVCCCSSRTPF